MKIIGRKQQTPITQVESPPYEKYVPHLHNKEFKTYRRGQDDHKQYQSKGDRC